MAEFVAEFALRAVGALLEWLWSLRPISSAVIGTLLGATTSLLIAGDVAYGLLWAFGGAIGFASGAIWSLRRRSAAPSHIDSP